MAIFLNFSPNSSHLHPLQVENCDSNSRLVVDEDDNGKVRLERVNTTCRAHIMNNCKIKVSGYIIGSGHIGYVTCSCGIGTCFVSCVFI